MNARNSVSEQSFGTADGDNKRCFCLVCLRRRTRSITNDRSPGWSVLRCCHGITQGQLGVVDDLVSPAEWWASSWAAP